MKCTFEFRPADCFFKNDRRISGFISKIRVSIFSLLRITTGIGHVVNRDVVSFTAAGIELVIVSSM